MRISKDFIAIGYYVWSNHIKMKCYNFIILLVLVFTIFSCKENQNIQTKKNELESDIKEIDKLLPKFINSEEYYIIYRFGAIFLSTDPGAVFGIKKGDINKSIIPFKYFSFNEIQQFEDEIIMHNSDEVQMQMFSLEYKSYCDKPFQTEQFKQYSKIKFKNYIPSKSESFCGNLFVMVSDNRFYVLNDSDIENYSCKRIISLIESVSQLEKIQALSLKRDCNCNDLGQMKTILKDSTSDFSLSWKAYKDYFAIDMSKYSSN